jgi:glutamyl-tRNA reductase
MIIGAGKMGEACVRHLSKKGARSVLVSNRSYERALSLATEFGGRAVRFDECLKGMVDADIVVSSTGSPETILRREDIASVMTARRNRPIFLIDIAVPRDIDPEVQRLNHVYLYNVDHLEALVRQNVQLREQELTKCQEIISGRCAALMNRFAQPPPDRQAPVRTFNPGLILGSAAPCPA